MEPIMKIIFFVLALRDIDINALLDNSDVEDFVPSDEDCDNDPSYLVSPEQLCSDNNSDSSGSETDEPAQNCRVIPRISHSTSGCAEPVSSTAPSRQGSTTWFEKDFSAKELNLLEPSYPEFPNNFEDPQSYFEQYVDDDFIKVIVEKTNQSSVLHNGRSLSLTKDELYVYIGITFIMASLNYPCIRMYWEKKWRVANIADHMSRTRFTQLRNSIKIVFDDGIPQYEREKDKLWKVRPLIEQIRRGCVRQKKNKTLSVDEMIIPFTGACGIKQYCPGKPNPVGVKAFVLANSDGLVCDFHIYQGNTTYAEYNNSIFGAGEKAVLTLADGLVPGHTLYFDRYFTTEKLADELNRRGIGCTGTMMKNRIPRAARSVLKDDKLLKREGRGSSQVIVRDDENLAITKWYDNKPVIMLSSVEAKDIIDYCQRWCKRDKKYVTVERPRVIREYNTNMGGVDLADRLLAVCPNRHRTKKWTQRFLSHMLDLAVSNSWIQFKKDQLNKNVPLKKIKQLRWFKMELGENLIDFYGNTNTEENSDEEDENVDTTNTKRKRGKPTTALPSKKQRLKEAKHMPIFIEKQARCRQCHYNKSKIVCNTCKIPLCLTMKRNCYLDFHS